MLLLIALAALVCGALTQGNNDKVLGCYYNNLSPLHDEGRFLIRDVDPFLCTHLFYAYATIENGVLAPSEWNDESTEVYTGMYELFNDLKMQNPTLKTLLSVGGKAFSTKFSDVVANGTSRMKFIVDSILYLRRWNFDGLDLHWQYPGDENKELFTDFIEELRSVYDFEAQTNSDKERLLLTATVAGDKYEIDASYEIDEIQDDLDFINLLTYDLRGPWESVTGHHTTTKPHPDDTDENQRHTVEWVVNEWLQRGAPANKLLVGMATYGRTFTLTGSENGINAPAQGGASPGEFTDETGLWSYFEICQKMLDVDQNFARKEETVREIIYSHNDKEWVGYDDVISIERKVSFIDAFGLRGAMVWSLDLDDFSGTFCGQGSWPLIKKMANMILGRNYTVPSQMENPPATTAPSTNSPICDGISDDFIVIDSCRPSYVHCVNEISAIAIKGYSFYARPSIHRI